MSNENLPNEPAAIFLDENDRQIFAQIRRCHADAVQSESKGEITPDSPLYGFDANILTAVQYLDKTVLSILMEAFEDLFQAEDERVEASLLRLFMTERLLGQLLKQQFGNFQSVLENVDVLLTSRPKRAALLFQHVKKMAVCTMCQKEPARFKDLDEGGGQKGIYCQPCMATKMFQAHGVSEKKGE